MSGIGLGQGSDDSIAVSNFPVSQAVTGPFLTDAQLRASAVPVSLAGVSTAALQVTGNASLASIDTKTPTLGQKPMAGSTPVVIASDQSTLPISAVILPLPTGAATSSLQTTGNASLAAIDAGIPAALGSTTGANAMPVVIASDQGSIPVTINAAANATKLEDDASASGDRGSFILGVRNDVDAVLTSADGDYSGISVDSSGRIKLSIGKAEDAAHVSGDRGAFILGVRNDADAVLTDTNLDYSPISVDSSGRVKTTSGTVSVAPTTSGGLSAYKNLDVNSTGQNIKASAGQVYSLIVSNEGSATRYLKLYNKASAPIVGTDVPVMTIMLRKDLLAVPIDISSGIAFSLGIGIAATAGPSDANAVNTAANDVIANVLFK